MENEAYGPRIQKLQERMAAANVEAFFTLAPPSMRYLTGFTGEEGYLLVAQGAVHLILDGRFTTQAQEECPWVDVIEYAGHFTRSVAELLVAVHTHWLGFEKERISFVQAEQMRTAMPSVVMVPTEGMVEGMRMVKDARELDMMRAAGRCADKAFSAMIRQLKAGMTENEVAAPAGVRKCARLARREPVSRQLSAQEHGVRCRMALRPARSSNMATSSSSTLGSTRTGI